MVIDVQITYKSGKTEIVEMKLSEYTAALVSLTEEGRLVKLRIMT